MSTVIRIARALAVLVGASLAILVSTAQIAPGWEPAPTLPDIAPDQLDPVAGASTGAIDERSIEVRKGIRAWVITPSDTTEAAPGVVLVAGSGAASRDALRQEARALASSGVAAIVYDKRRDGYSFFTRDFERLADDAAIVADALAALPGVDADRIGILGWSEGGWIAPLAIERNPERFAFLAMVSASVVSPMEEIAWTVDRPIASAPHWVRRVPAMALNVGRQHLDYADFDVRPVLASIGVPTYAVWGADDRSVPVAVAVAALRSSSTAPVTVRIVPGAGHGVPANGWAPGAAVWMRHASVPPSDDVRGAEPASHLGLSVPPTPVWYTEPELHLAVTVGLAAASVPLPIGGRRRGGRS